MLTSRPALLRTTLSDMDVPAAEISALLAEPSTAQAARNAAWKEQAQELGVGSVPRFFVSCGGSQDQCAAVERDSGGNTGPTTPSYFLAAFRRCTDCVGMNE